MKKFEITNVETLAFDDQIVTMKAPDCTIKMHIHDQSQFKSTNDIGKIIPITIDSAEKKVAVKKASKKTPAVTA
jgi:hypothetical protein